MKTSYLNHTQLAEFFTEFYLLRLAHFSESEALKLLSEEQDNKIMQDFLTKLTPDFIQGLTHYSIPDYLIVLLTRTQNNIQVFSDIAVHLKQSDYKKQIIHYLWYPILVLLIALVLANVIMIFVLPVFTELFASMNTNLPSITQYFIAIGQYAPWFIGLLLIVVLLLIVCLKSRYGFQCLLKVPMIHSIILATESTAILNTLYLLSKYQFNFFEALRLSATVSQHTRINETLNHGTNNTLWAELEKTGIFSTKTLRFLKVFAESQELLVLENLVVYHQQITQEKINLTLRLLNSLLSILCWLFIGLMVIALYLPIFQLGAVIA